MIKRLLKISGVASEHLIYILIEINRDILVVQNQ
jgi:hypothetical protein